MKRLVPWILAALILAGGSLSLKHLLLMLIYFISYQQAGVFITYFSTFQILTFFNMNFYIRTSSSVLSNALLAS